jgi:E3 ubiquitin-protein ligase RNF25
VRKIKLRIFFQIPCPVCRESLPEDLVHDLDTSLSSIVPEADGHSHKYVPSDEIIEMQQKMAALYRRQLEKGGIIDAEAERNKYLVPKVT